jgi:hypothetical protein
MSDETGPEQIGRDPELAATLAVPALDAATRRRLVTTALEAEDLDTDDTDDDELAHRRSSRVAAAFALAAAIVIGAVVGTVIVTQPEDQAARTVARAPETTGQEAAKAASPDGAGATDSRAAEAPAAASAPLVDLGDLGTISGADGVRAAVEARLEAGATATPGSSPCLQVSPDAAAGIYGLVSITAAGTADLDGRTVVVFVGPTTAGDSVAVLLDPARGCEFIQNVSL